MRERFRNRVEAGRTLAEKLKEYADREDVVVLALPRGGVPVAAEVASALKAPLDVLVVRKLGLPGQPEFAMGAIASGGARVLHDRVIRRTGVNQQQLQAVCEKELAELQRREYEYRGERPYPDLRDRTVIVVDDGLATGASMEAAVQALQAHGPAEIVVAVPVAPKSAGDAFIGIADRFVAAMEPEIFNAVGEWYVEFDQTSDDEVRLLLDASKKEES